MTKIFVGHNREILVRESVADIDGYLDELTPADHGLLQLVTGDGRQIRVAISAIFYYCEARE